MNKILYNIGKKKQTEKKNDQDIICFQNRSVPDVQFHEIECNFNRNLNDYWFVNLIIIIQLTTQIKC